MTCHVEADDVATQSVPFFLPRVQLREGLRSKPAQLEQTLSTQPISSAPIGSTVLESALSDNELNSRVIRSGEFYLTRSAAPSNSGLVRFVEGIFTPEVIHVGKASVACPVVTAIKKKNPLCLLSGFATVKTLSDDAQITYKLLQVWW